MNFGKIISADDHVQETPDLWVKRLPAAMRDHAPRIIKLDNGAAAWAWGKNAPRPLGMDVWAGREIKDHSQVEKVMWDEVNPATYDPDARLKAMDRDSIQAAVLYPNFARAFVGMWLTDNAQETGKTAKLDSDLTVACIQVYNDFIAEFCNTNSKRLVPIGVIPLESVEVAVAEIKRMGKKGIRGGLIPPEPGKGRFWNDPVFEPMWQAMAEAGMSINLHVGPTPGVRLPSPVPTEAGVGPGSAEATSTLLRLAMAIPTTTILWSGIFDRYPSIKMVAVETDIGWMAYMKERAEWVYRNFGWRWHREPNLKNHPGHYFGRNLFATFQEDIAGIQSRHLIGIGALCWASDFPHPETTWPNTKKSLEEQFKGVPEADVRQMTCDNAAGIYNIPL